MRKCLVCEKNTKDHTLEEAQKCYYISRLKVKSGGD